MTSKQSAGSYVQTVAAPPRLSAEQSAAPTVQVRGLTKTFTDFWRRPKVRALDNLDLEVSTGEIFGLLGPNGSGKTTTLKILLGLLHPTAGEVRVLGKPPSDVTVKALLGYVPEESCLYGYLTAEETLDFFGRLFGIDRMTRRERTRRLIELMDLVNASRRPIREFSKGMARRLSIAQALVNEPALLILDEPTSGLDPIGCRGVKDLLSGLARQGTTIVLSSHLLADVEDICDRVAIMYNGRVLAQGRMHDLLRRKDSMTLTIPALPPDEIREVLRMLRGRLPAEPRIEHTSINLEQFFVDVVREAQKGQAQRQRSES